MPPPSLTWNATAGRFQRPDGRFVPASVVRAELDKSLVATANRVRALGDDLRAGRVSLDAWRQAMKDEIKAAHLRSAALARGGWSQMDQAAFGRTGQIIRTEYHHLEAWTQQIKSGWVLDGRLSSRGQLYTAAARGTFHQVQREEMIKRGNDLERSLLHPAEHCPECLAQAALGWVPLGTLVPIGSRQCLRNCKCTISFSRSAAA
jgi:hypothetical protein